MPERVEPGQYIVGRIDRTRRGMRPLKCGTYGVIRGENAEQKGQLEWSHIGEGILKTSQWIAYRIGPGENGTGTRTDLLKAFDTKGDAVDFLKARYGSKFDEVL